MCLGPGRVAAAGRICHGCASGDPRVAGRAIIARGPDRCFLAKWVFGTDYARPRRTQFAESQLLCVRFRTGGRRSGAMLAMGASAPGKTSEPWGERSFPVAIFEPQTCGRGNG